MPIPSPEQLCLEIPLYKPLHYTVEEIQEILNVLFGKGYIDAFCVDCNKESTFHTSDNFPSAIQHLESCRGIPGSGNINQQEKSLLMQTRFFSKLYTCTRNNNHFIYYVFCINKDSIIKIGQLPSMADLTKSNVQKYNRLLGREKFAELNKAIGLAAHGVGIGSFVYLRRIFEGLIEDAHLKTQKFETWDEAQYQKSRIDEKIYLLNGLLPKFLIENRKIYSILSKGIHELNEDECLKIFPAVMAGIELILDEKLQEQEREMKIKKAANELTKLHEQFNK